MVSRLQSDLSSTNYNPFVGAVTSKILLNVLSDNGLHETALRTATATTEPSWGFWWARNSTTCWEAFPQNEGKPGHGSGKSGVAVPSNGGTLNHIFLCGGVAEWMWKHLIGLTATAPQFRMRARAAVAARPPAQALPAIAVDAFSGVAEIPGTPANVM